MEKRINLYNVEPQAYEAMYALENYLKNASITDEHIALIKIRASQINGCAYCLNMHTKEALKLGETQKRIFLMSAWKESGLFSEEEQTILAMTEEVTLIHQNGLSDETYKKAEQHFDEHYIGQIIMAIVTINAWNRMAISTNLPI